jgi:hypothetical protein
MVQSHRVNGKPRQTVVATLGRLDALKETGELDRLLRSGARLTESGMLLSAVEKGETTTIDAKRIGPPLLFERLWRDSFCRSVIENLLAGRKFEFPVERAVFLTVLHRIMDPGSDRAADKWRSAYCIGGMDAIDLHHLYRAMAWLGEELADQQGRGLVPRSNKDLIEEQLFAKLHRLFNDVALAILDSATLYLEGEGGMTLGRNWHSKDSSPDLDQTTLGASSTRPDDQSPVRCDPARRRTLYQPSKGSTLSWGEILWLYVVERWFEKFTCERIRRAQLERAIYH